MTPALPPISPVSPDSPAGGAAQDQSRLIDLAYGQYCEREENGEDLDPGAFCAQFPEIREELHKLIEAHRLVVREFHPGRVEGEPAWPAPGEPFLGFRLERLLGKGAFSRVYQATQPQLGNRLVAVKITFRPAHEAATLGPLQHPNIVPVYAATADPLTGLTLLCMPYEGRATLDDVQAHAFRGGCPRRAALILEAARDPVWAAQPHAPQPPPDRVLRRGSYAAGVAHLGRQLAQALAFLHDRGIRHFDLKPSNVLVTPSGKPLLLDFNLAHDRRFDLEALGGTLPYMSPELLRATAPESSTCWRVLDGRSDLFSLGVILYSLLTGRHPFGPLPAGAAEEEVREYLLARQEHDPVLVREVNPRVGARLARVIERCLAPDPGRRFPNGTELAAALHWAGGRRRWWVVLGAATAAAAALLVAVALAARPPTPTVEQVRDVYRRGDYRQALRLCDRALRQRPDLPELFFARARAHQRLGHFRAALADYQRADHLARGRDGRFLAGIGYCQSHERSPCVDHQAAIAHFLRAIGRGFAPAEVYNNLGYCYLRRNLPQEAETYLNRALTLNPRFQAALYNRAKLFLHQALHSPHPPEQVGFLRRGLKDIRETLRQGPRSADLDFDAARLFALAAAKGWHRQRSLPKAFQHLKRALEQGIPGAQVQSEVTFRYLRQGPRAARFARLLNQPFAKQTSSPSLRVVDPLTDFPD